MITGVGESIAPIIEETSHFIDHVMYFLAGSAVGPSIFGLNKLRKKLNGKKKIKDA